MKEDSKEIHIASTKQLNIKLAKEKGKKRNFYSQAAISLKKLQTPNEIVSAIFYSLQTNQIHQYSQKRKRKRKERQKEGRMEGRKERRNPTF